MLSWNWTCNAKCTSARYFEEESEGTSSYKYALVYPFKYSNGGQDSRYLHRWILTFHAGGIMMSSLVGQVCPQDKTSGLRIYNTRTEIILWTSFSLSKAYVKNKICHASSISVFNKDKYHNSSICLCRCRIEKLAFLLSSCPPGSVAKSIPQPSDITSEHLSNSI